MTQATGERYGGWKQPKHGFCMIGTSWRAHPEAKGIGSAATIGNKTGAASGDQQRLRADNTDRAVD
jgi:hypothetical protein